MRDDGYFDYRHVGFGFLGLCAVTVLLAIGLLVGAFLDPKQFAFSYLFAFFVFFTLAIGALFWVLVHHVVDAEWSVVLRRQWENLASLLTPLAVLFVPFVFVAPLLWKWMDPAYASDHLLHEKAAYLNQPFFWIRAVLYFFVFAGVATLLRSFSVEQDRSGLPRYTLLNRRTSFASLMPFALALTFAAVDWLMGLDFHWFSTMWGVYIFAGSALSALCVTALIVLALQSVGYLPMVTREHYQLLGRLMLAFTTFWAYIAFSQYMLIWYSNIPEETIYYALRNTGSWRIFSTALVIGHFFLPFLLLLPEFTKRNPRFLCAVAGWILLMHILDLYIVILPVLHPEGVSPHLLDLLALLVVGGVLAIIFLKRLGDSPLLPVRDPRLPASLHIHH